MSIKLDYDDVARRIDVFIEDGSIFRLFEPDDVLEIVKRSNLVPEKITILAKYLRIYYDESTVIKILTEMSISTNNSKYNFQIIKNILDILEIPALHKIFSLINSPKKNKLIISSSSCFETFPITFAELRINFNEGDDIDLTVFLRYLQMDIKKAENYIMRWKAEIEEILFGFVMHHLRHATYVTFELIRKHDLKIDISELIDDVISSGDIQCIRMLIENGIDFSYYFVRAIKTGHLHVVKYLLHKYPVSNEQLIKLRELAVEFDHFHLLEFLMNDNFNLHEDDFKPSVIHEQFKQQHDDKDCWLCALMFNDMDYFKKMTSKLAGEMTQLFVASISFQDYKLLDKLFQLDCIQMILTQNDKELLLVNALVHGCLEVIEVVFKYLFDPNLYNYYYVLSFIHISNKTSIIKQLSGIVNFTYHEYLFFITFSYIDLDPDTHNFVDQKLKEIVKSENKSFSGFKHIPVGCLQEREIDNGIPNALGRAPKNSSELVYLIDCAGGCDITSYRDETINSKHVTVCNDMDALMLSCMCGSARNIKILKHWGFDLDEVNIAGYSPIHVACKYGKLEVVKLLHKYKCNVKATNADGHNGMHYAIAGGYAEIIDFYLKLGVKIDQDFCIEHGHFMALKHLKDKSLITKSSSLVKKIRDSHREDVFELLNLI